jgi:hypothetical protein
MQEARLEEYKKIIDQKTSLRRSNLNPERPGSYFFALSLILFHIHLLITNISDSRFVLSQI